MTGTSTDLGELKDVFAERIPEPMKERVHFQALDFFKEDFPTVDVVIFGGVLHDWDDETKIMLLKKAYDALPEGGYVVVYDFFIDNERKEKTHSFLMSLHMMLQNPGNQFTFNQCEKWFVDQGFSDVQSYQLDLLIDCMVGVKKTKTQ